jgi:hypothetical protein
MAYPLSCFYVSQMAAQGALSQCPPSLPLQSPGPTLLLPSQKRIPSRRPAEQVGKHSAAEVLQDPCLVRQQGHQHGDDSLSDQSLVQQVQAASRDVKHDLQRPMRLRPEIRVQSLGARHHALAANGRGAVSLLKQR